MVVIIVDKIDALKSFDEKKLSKLGHLRNDWLDSGSDMILSGKTELNVIANKLSNYAIKVKIKAVLSENVNYKTVILNSLDGEELPFFKAGQRIAITLCIHNKYYTNSYSLSSNPLQARNGEYSILVKNEENIVSDYLFNQIKKEEILFISSPFGEFYYNPLRDEKNIIAIVNGEGIAPIVSMIQAIASGILNIHLTIFYSEKVEDDLLFKEELMEYDKVNSKISVYFVLSAQEVKDMMSGFVSLNKIKKVYKEGETSIFIAGTEGLLKYLDNELKGLKLAKKYIRYDSFLPSCNIRKVVQYKLTIYFNDKKYVVPCYNNKTIISSIFESGIYIPSKCQNGSCGFCRSELLSGEVKIVNDKRIKAEKKYNIIHPCSTYPLSDIEIIVR